MDIQNAWLHIIHYHIFIHYHYTTLPRVGLYFSTYDQLINTQMTNQFLLIIFDVGDFKFNSTHHSLHLSIFIDTQIHNI